LESSLRSRLAARLNQLGAFFTMSEESRDPRTYAIIGAAIEVHRRLGYGFSEPVYQEALAVELAHRSIPSQRELELPISYRGQILRAFYKADFLCYGSIIVELKALSGFDSANVAQVINYLKATGNAVGLLLKFGTSRLECRRVIFSGPTPEVFEENPTA
jgi:GxxExxY protein